VITVLFSTVIVELTVTTVPFVAVIFWIVEFTETVVLFERSVSACLFDEVVVVDEFDEDEFSEVEEVDEFDEVVLEEDEEDEVVEVFVEVEDSVEGEEYSEGDGTFDVELEEGDGTFDEVEFVEDELEEDGEGTFAEVDDELEEDGEGTFDDWFEDVSFWHKYDWVSFTMSAREGSHHVVLTPAP